MMKKALLSCRLGVLMLAACDLWACAQKVKGEPRPLAFYYPLDVELAPDGTHAYVVSSNFDHRFTSGWISTIDLEEVKPRDPADGTIDGAVDGVLAPGKVIVAEGGQLSVPSLGGPLAVEPGPNGKVAVLAHRGEQVITVLAIVDGVLSCGDAESTAGLTSVEQETDCDRRHMFKLNSPANLSAAEWGTTIPLAALNDPYAVTIFTSNGETRVAVGFLSRDSASPGLVLVYTIKLDSDPILEPWLRVPLGSGVGTTSGASSLAVHPAGNGPTGGVRLAVGSRRLRADDLQSTVFDIDIEAMRAAPFATYATPHGLSDVVGGFDTVDLTFLPKEASVVTSGLFAAGDFAYVANRSPDGIAILDARLVPSEAGRLAGQFPSRNPRYAVLDFVPLQGAPGGVIYIPRANDGDVLAALSLDNNEVDLLRVTGGQVQPAARVRDIGNGPFGSTLATLAGHDPWLVVATFYDHGISIVTVPKGDLTRANCVVQIRDSSFGATAH